MMLPEASLALEILRVAKIFAMLRNMCAWAIIIPGHCLATNESIHPHTTEKECGPASKSKSHAERVGDILLQEPLWDEFVGLGVDRLVMKYRPYIGEHCCLSWDVVPLVLVVI